MVLNDRETMCEYDRVEVRLNEVYGSRFRESGTKTIEGKRGNETKTRTRQHGAKRVTRVEEGELSFVRENVAGDVNVNLEKG